MTVFEAFFLPWMRRRLSAHVAGALVANEGLPVVLVSNHVSWWDGFLLREVHRLLGGSSPLFTVMREDELERRPFLRRIGCLGVDPARSASTLRLLRQLRVVRERETRPWVSFFPQGVIRPSWARPLEFRRGIEGVLRVMEPVTLVPVGLHLEPLNRLSPAAFVSVGPAMRWTDSLSGGLERAVGNEVDRILDFVRVNGENTPAVWPAVTERLPAPRDGVGAVKGET